MFLEFSVENQRLKKCGRMVDVVNDSQDYLRLKFHFLSDDWEGLTKYVFFRVKNINYPYELDGNDELLVPSIFTSGDKLFFGVYGVDNGTIRVTTNALRVDLVDSYYDAETVDIRNFLEVMVDDLNDRIDTKADTVYVDAELDLKADKTYVDTEFIVRDTEIAKKSDKSYVDTELAGKSDVGHNHDERYYTESEIDTKLNRKVDKVTGKGLSKNDFTDYYKNFLDGFDGDIEAFLLDHKEEIEALISSDVLSGYYLKSEVDELLHNLNNRLAVNSTSDVIQVGDTTDIYAHTLKNGMPCIQKKVHFFERLEPSITLSASQQIIQLDENVEVYARVKDSDGSLAQNMKVHFFKEDGEELINENIETNNLNNNMEE